MTRIKYYPDIFLLISSKLGLSDSDAATGSLLPSASTEDQVTGWHSRSMIMRASTSMSVPQSSRSCIARALYVAFPKYTVTQKREDQTYSGNSVKS